MTLEQPSASFQGHQGQDQQRQGQGHHPFLACRVSRWIPHRSGSDEPVTTESMPMSAICNTFASDQVPFDQHVKLERSESDLDADVHNE